MMNVKNLFPREHGAWAILILPYVIGTVVGGGFSGKSFLGLVSIILLFLGRQPLGMMAKSWVRREKRSGRPSSTGLMLSFMLLSSTGTGLLLWLVIKSRVWDLLLIGSGALFLILFHTFLTAHGKARTVVGEIIGVAALTSTAPLGFLLSSMKISQEVFVLWLLNLMYFSGSIFYIKMRKKGLLSRKNLHPLPKNMNLVRECLAYLLVLVIILGLLMWTGSIPVLVTLAFVPMIFHSMLGILILRPRFEIIKQGVIQTQVALVYAVLFILFWK
jgi:hypothetical protein